MCVSGQNKIMKSNTTHFIMVEESAHMRLLVTADNLTPVLRCCEGGYNKQKFNVTNFKEVLSCVEVITQQCHKYRDEWTCPPAGVDLLHLSESMQDLQIEKTPSSTHQAGDENLIPPSSPTVVTVLLIHVAFLRVFYSRRRN